MVDLEKVQAGKAMKRHLDRGSHYGIREKPGRKITRNPQRLPQLRLLAIMKSIPELAFHSNQIGEYPNCHHRV